MGDNHCSIRKMDAFSVSLFRYVYGKIKDNPIDNENNNPYREHGKQR